jgi:hypothetical protein
MAIYTCTATASTLISDTTAAPATDIGATRCYRKFRGRELHGAMTRPNGGSTAWTS